MTAEPRPLVGHRVHGQGQPLLLIAGWAQAGSFWHRFLPHLPSGLSAITIDNRETGATGPCPEGFTIDDLAADALAVMDHLGHERFGLLGHSMGGVIAQAIAFAAPERVDHLVLASTRPGASRDVAPDPAVLAFPDIELPDDAEQAAIAVRAAYLERFIAPGSHPPRAQLAREEAERAPGDAPRAEGLMRQAQALSIWEPPAKLAELELAVSVLHGDADTLVPHANGQAVAELAGVTLQTLPGVGHMLPWEAPADLAMVLAETRARA